MCGIFGFVAKTKISQRDFKKLVNHSQQRGKDSSGFIFLKDNTYNIHRADFKASLLFNEIKENKSKLVFGHSRLITNGLSDNQPIIKNDIILLHNGIIVNEDEIWDQISIRRELVIDSETIIAIAEEHFNNNGKLENLPDVIFNKSKGIVSCAMLLPKLGKLLLFSNNGSLYIGKKNGDVIFASESYALKLIGCNEIKQILNSHEIYEIPKSENTYLVNDYKNRVENLIPNIVYSLEEEKCLEYNDLYLKRCTKCILPETMPFITFNENGVCNYCLNYKTRNLPKPKEELFKLVEPYRRLNKERDCIVPFSGGRDSCYGLHLIIEELKLKPITYTYDWGMVTDLGRRNISRMCSQLGVENIIVAADISLKRNNIRKNLLAWTKSPNLGMMAMLTAGDKHFFRHVEDIKKQTGINLNLWGVNPLEITHFKTGFLGIPPNFEEKKVYNNGVINQLYYHVKRFNAMLESPSYFNSSLWDTLSGEYHRSFTEKKDYFHLFDYWRWDENEVNSCLLDKYDWEMAVDTSTTWRIGDGTAAFYNYVYYTVAGFTEHDTFRSNQIREGQITREKAIELISIENRPRYQNIRWYLDTLNLDFKEIIKVVNNIPKKYNIY